MTTNLSFFSLKPTKARALLFPNNSSSLSPYTPKPLFRKTHFASSYSRLGAKKRKNTLFCNCSTVPFVSPNATHYEFVDDSSEVELRLELGEESITPGDILVDASDNTLLIKVRKSGNLQTLLDTNSLFGVIKPSETIWYIDDAQLVVNLKKLDPELKWPDIVESWESLTTGLVQLLKGTSVFLVGESTEINQKVARELAVGLGYTPLSTKELLESYIKQTIDTWVREESSDTVAEAEYAVLESLSSQARTVVATLGGKHGAAVRPNKWQHLFSGFTVWLSQSEAKDEGSAKEEAKKNMEDGNEGYSNAEVVVKLAGWDPTYSKAVAQASLSALKRLVLSDKKLTGRKSLYVRMGCRGDWPDIKPPGWDPSSSGAGAPTPS
ncbi:Probable inactive shikimate kinase like 2-chloroplastic [Striga hermonthica]|uniref:Probable inactive shikimate kinase like 2-chloroplastic n=1 Tax=Striga hermonthica TaxID=68872 RepID=A0A9N7RDL8_STRHE|nr:Probable inactive shikimate kinase like 2-chloroplastic [Striga hermonthica]